MKIEKIPSNLILTKEQLELVEAHNAAHDAEVSINRLAPSWFFIIFGKKITNPGFNIQIASLPEQIRHKHS